MAKMIIWKTEEEITENLKTRYQAAQQARRDFEVAWELNERSILNGTGEQLDPYAGINSLTALTNALVLTKI
jgi:hypothetical protein